jgi:hypothetical protein
MMAVAAVAVYVTGVCSAMFGCVLQQEVIRWSLPFRWRVICLLAKFM